MITANIPVDRIQLETAIVNYLVESYKDEPNATPFVTAAELVDGVFLSPLRPTDDRKRTSKIVRDALSRMVTTKRVIRQIGSQMGQRVIRVYSLGPAAFDPYPTITEAVVAEEQAVAPEPQAEEQVAPEVVVEVEVAAEQVVAEQVVAPVVEPVGEPVPAKKGRGKGRGKKSAEQRADEAAMLADGDAIASQSV